MQSFPEPWHESVVQPCLEYTAWAKPTHFKIDTEQKKEHGPEMCGENDSRNEEISVWREIEKVSTI